jgi:hypothetical protein
MCLAAPNTAASPTIRRRNIPVLNGLDRVTHRPEPSIAWRPTRTIFTFLLAEISEHCSDIRSTIR